MSATPVSDLERDLSAGERELLHELLAAIRRIRYGSVVMTIHDGRIVEVNKTERIRKSSA
jgi:hypothetical protein